MMKLPGAWEIIEREIKREITSGPQSFSPDTVAHISDFLSYISGRCPLPDEVGKGYWATMCFSWDYFQVEVFGNHVELYWFREGETKIQHFDHKAGEPWPTEVIAALPTVSV